MIVNLNHVDFVTFAGNRIKLHFRDGSIHMQHVESVRQLDEVVSGWQYQTQALAAIKRPAREGAETKSHLHADAAKSGDAQRNRAAASYSAKSAAIPN